MYFAEMWKTFPEAGHIKPIPIRLLLNDNQILIKKI